MIRSLKRKFVILAMVSISLLLAVIVSGMNIINFRATVAEADEMLRLLSDNRDSFPNFPRRAIPPGMSLEAPYEARFFSVLLDESGNAAEVHTTRIAAVDRETAVEYARQAVQDGGIRGFVEEFRYMIAQEGEHSRVTFLDCGRKLHAVRIFLQGSVVMSLAGLTVLFAVMMFSAERIIRPVAESYEKQKRFITDAGHEIKTPLTIINANAELLEMDIGENECLSDIRQQAKRLGALTNDLVYLARMEEAENKPELLDLPISDIVQETAADFKAIAQAQNKELTADIEPMLSMRGSQKELRQLVSILMDNAMKYSPEQSPVHIGLKKTGRLLRLTVKNRAVSPLEAEDIKHLFDRFYRADSSRNSSTGGHGIGLSIAQAITAAHGGKIQARSDTGQELEITVSFPL